MYVCMDVWILYICIYIYIWIILGYPHLRTTSYSCFTGSGVDPRDDLEIKRQRLLRSFPVDDGILLDFNTLEFIAVVFPTEHSKRWQQ